MFSGLTTTMILTEASTFFGYVAPLVALALGISVAGRVVGFFRRVL